MQPIPKFTGFIRQLVENKVVTVDQMNSALDASKQIEQDIVAYLIHTYHIPALTIAKAISNEFGEPLFDLAAYDSSLMIKDIVSDSIITQYKILPIFKRANLLYIATYNPTNLEPLERIRFSSQMNIEIVIVEYDKLKKLIELHYSHEEIFNFNEDFELDLNDDTKQTTPPEEETANQDESPIVKYINKLLIDAIRLGASDLHFEPYEKTYRVRYRIDGVLRQIATPPLQLASRLASRIKIMSQMDISEKRVPQDGRIKLKFSQHKAIDFRVNSLPTLFGEKLVLRILDSSSTMVGIDALGYEPEQKALFMEALAKPQGMLLITGPTGSGKTVSLYTGLNILNCDEVNISTVEDPIEINLEGINQVNVNTKVGLTFATALRSFLRQDPDIIMVGEIRDLETAEIAVKAAQTGHMVMSTLHTNSAPETLTRLRNMGIPSFNIATSINLVIAQRLARRLCHLCKKPIDVPAHSLLEMGFKKIDLEQTGFQLYEAHGCPTCHNGYKGQVGIYEVMKMTPEIAKLIMEDGNAIQISEMAHQLGFQNLRRSGLLKVMQGITSLQEVNRVTNE